MSIYAIGDLHLSKNDNKRMDVFGDSWKDYIRRICDAWTQTITRDDTVLIPGDISWAMTLEGAIDDLSYICDLPGEKVFIRGNHDYWWSSRNKMSFAFQQYKDFHFIINDSLSLNGYAYAGSRGWLCPSSVAYSASKDAHIYLRELHRLEMSLSAMNPELPKIALMHFPPIPENGSDTGFTELFERYGVLHVVYGHLHGKSCKNGFSGNKNGVSYHLCSADYIDFEPVRIIDS